jgi:hypothetical protein
MRMVKLCTHRHRVDAIYNRSERKRKLLFIRMCIVRKRQKKENCLLFDIYVEINRNFHQEFFFR